MTTTPVPHAAAPAFGQAAPEHPHEFAHPDATDRIVAQRTPTFGQSMGSRSTEFKNALIAGGVGIAVAFLAAGFGLGYWAGDAGSSSDAPQSGFSQMGGGQTGSGQMGGGQAGPGQMGGGQTGSGQTGSGQTGSGQTGSGQTGSGTQNGFPGGTAPGAGTGTGSGTGTGTTTS